MDQIAEAERKSTIEVVVMRCGCGNPEAIHPGTPCPKPRKVTNLGEVSYQWEGHPYRTALMAAWIWVRRRFINDR